MPSRDELRARLAALRPAPAPSVSAIVPCFNYGRLVTEAVNSLRNQTYPGLEIVVVDDGSTDTETQEALRELERDGVRVVHQENRGLVGARNRGVEETRGDLLLFLDNDDLLEPEAVELLVAGLAANPECGFAYPDQWFFGDEELIWETQPFNAYDLCWANHPTVCSLIRRDALESVGGYDPRMTHGWEDWELWQSLAAAGAPGRRVPAPVFRHRRHGRTMTHTARDRGDVLRDTLLEKHGARYTPEALAATKAAWRPAVTVILPYHNAHAFLDETLASLDAQSFDDFEVLIVNDGSDDPESLRKLDEVRMREGLRVLDRPERGDLAAARNSGVRAARGDYVLFLDPDDLIAPTTVEKLVWSALLNPRFGFHYTGVVHFGEVEGVCLDTYDPVRLRTENFLTSMALLPRQMFLDVGGLDETIRVYFEDYDFWLKLASLKIPGRLVAEPLFFYRRHSTGRSAWVRDRLSPEESLAQLQARNPAAFGDPPPAELPDAYRPLGEEPEPVDDVARGLARRLREDAGGGVRRESARRPNVPGLFPARHRNGRKTRVLYLVPYVTVGGAERVDLEILAGLPRDEFHVTLVEEIGGDDSWRDEFAALTDEQFSVPHVAETPDAALTFLEYLAISRNVDVVFNRNTSVGYEAARQWRSRYPQIRFADLMHLHNSGEDWIRSSLAAHSAMHRRFVITRDLRDYAASTYDLPAEDFRVVHCGVDTEAWNPDRVTGTLRSVWPEAAGGPVVAFVGRLDEQKDPVRWLNAAKRIAEQEPGVRFLMIGDGPLREEVEAAAARSGLA
ncbi:MAG: glycosyltransferase, partial [Gemmatimonadetes bacterium]|nr:glycosyltransferase [Gemmatimonadota bacterium]